MKKLCHNPRCNQEFETEFNQREYCSQKCKRIAKELRTKTRDTKRNIVAQEGSAAGKIENPTLEQLAALSLVYAAKANSVPTLVTGVIPEGWNPPKGVSFILQQGVEPPTFLMQSEELDIMELWRQQNETTTAPVGASENVKV